MQEFQAMGYCTSPSQPQTTPEVEEKEEEKGNVVDLYLFNVRRVKDIGNENISWHLTLLDENSEIAYEQSSLLGRDLVWSKNVKRRQCLTPLFCFALFEWVVGVQEWN